MEQIKEAVYLINDERYLHLRENSAGVGFATYNKVTGEPLESGQISEKNLPPDGQNTIPAARNWYLFELSDDDRKAIQQESVKILAGSRFCTGDHGDHQPDQSFILKCFHRGGARRGDGKRVRSRGGRDPEACDGIRRDGDNHPGGHGQRGESGEPAHKGQQASVRLRRN